MRTDSLLADAHAYCTERDAEIEMKIASELYEADLDRQLDEQVLTADGWDRWAERAVAADWADLNAWLAQSARAGNDEERVEANRAQIKLFKRVLSF